MLLLLAGRTLWFIGDSQTWHSYYSAECFLRSYALDFVRRPATNSSQGEMPLRPVTWPVIVASMCIHLREDTRICNVRPPTNSSEAMNKNTKEKPSVQNVLSMCSFMKTRAETQGARTSKHMQSLELCQECICVGTCICTVRQPPMP